MPLAQALNAGVRVGLLSVVLLASCSPESTARLFTDPSCELQVSPPCGADVICSGETFSFAVNRVESILYSDAMFRFECDPVSGSWGGQWTELEGGRDYTALCQGIQDTRDEYLYRELRRTDVFCEWGIMANKSQQDCLAPETRYWITTEFVTSNDPSLAQHRILTIPVDLDASELTCGPHLHVFVLERDGCQERHWLRYEATGQGIEKVSLSINKLCGPADYFESHVVLDVKAQAS